MINLLHSIGNLTYNFIPYTAGLNFILLIIFILLNRKNLKRLFLESFDKKTLIYFLLILILSTLIRFIPKDLHYHRMWLDDFYYMEAAKSIAGNNFSEIRYFKYIGWPFILSIFFALFSVNNWVALYASSLFGTITAINIFLITFLITENKKMSLLASLIFSLLPYHIIWSFTAETNVASLFFVTLSIFFYLIFYRYKKSGLFWLSCVSTAFTMQFRPENYSLPILFLIGIIIFYRGFLKKINLKHILILILIFSLTIPDFVNWMRGFQESSLRSLILN